jgi:hypothetical protein
MKHDGATAAKFGVDDLARLLDEGRRFSERCPILLLGAGASYNLLPVVDELKKQLVDWLLRRVHDGSEVRRSRILDRLKQPHLTLEVLCSLFRYRSGRGNDGRPRFDASRFWRRLCAGVGCNDFSRSLAILSREGLLGPILTSNFDEMLADAYRSASPRVPFRYTTAASLQWNQQIPQGVQEIIAFHGTICSPDITDPTPGEHSPPTSALARGLASPFPKVLHTALVNALTGGAPVIAVGYRGGDHFDMNPLLAALGDQGRRPCPWYWLSHDGMVAQGFSHFVQKRFSDRFFAANAHLVFPAYCREKLGREIPAPASRSGPPWESRISNILHDFDMPEEACEALLADLEHNLPGPWVVLEHYYLFSNSFLEDDTLTFGGVDEKDGSVAHLDFFDSSYGELLLAQHGYWKEDSASRSLSAEARVAFGYPESRRAFGKVVERIERVLDGPGSVPRPEYRALLFVGLAYAADYLGLIENKTRMALDELCAKAEADGTDAGRLEELRRRRDQARELALRQFRTCTTLALNARALLEKELGGTGTKDLGDLVQHELWAMIGEENTARAMPPSEAWRSFQSAIRRRRALLESLGPLGEEEYRCSHLTQLFLRASEMVKALLLIETDTQPPRRGRKDLPVEEQEALDEAIRVARESFEDYAGRVGPTADRRFPAYFEAEILYHASREDLARSRAKFREFQRAFDDAPEKIRTSTRRWMENAQVRFAAIEARLRR